MILAKLVDFKNNTSEISFENSKFKISLDSETVNPERVLCAALASCISATISLFAKTEGFGLYHSEAQVRYEMADNSEQIAAIYLFFKLDGDFNQEQLENMKIVATESPLINSLNPNIQINISFNSDLHI